MDSDIKIGDELPPERRGPPVLLTLALFLALVAVAVVAVFGLTSVARFLQGLI